MNSYSFAGPTRGTDDPSNVRIIKVNSQDDCPHDRCQRAEPHTIIMWSGDEYSKNNTWVSGTESDIVNLEDAR